MHFGTLHEHHMGRPWHDIVLQAGLVEAASAREEAATEHRDVGDHDFLAIRRQWARHTASGTAGIAG